MTTRRGVIVAAQGRHYDVLLDSGANAIGYPRGKRSEFACGDTVELTTDGHLSANGPRASLLYRSDAYREKLIAANVTLVVVVVAAAPAFSDALVSRALVAAESQHLSALIVLNKTDLPDALEPARRQLQPFVAVGYPVIEMSARTDVAPLRAHLQGHHAILVGQSGMGKSTLTNALVPDAGAATRDISLALGTGKHTTTCARRYVIDADSSLTDSPGLQAFGLAHLDRNQIEDGFVEFRAYRGQCRYRDCSHRHEPDCAILAAVRDGAIAQQRLAHFHELIAQGRR